MKDLIVLCLLALVAGASAQCTCPTMKWGACDGTPCTCTVLVGNAVKQKIDCNKLVPKCFLMQAEMYRAKNNMSTRSIGGKPVETALLDNDGIYDPECESDGSFKAVQCNGTETCWCVNSAGVRRSDKGDKNIKCEPVETYWVRLELKHNASSGSLDETVLKNAIQTTLNSRYKLDSSLINNFQYDSNGRLIIVDIQKKKGERGTDLPTMAYYCEKDVKALPLFLDKTPLLFNVNGKDVAMESILVYFVDEKAPTITMKPITGGVIAVIVVVILVVLIGLLVLFFLRRREKARYSKAQPREMEAMS
ncbi:epithelial cell adhesion molecule isoform 1-T2 [Clarias gariepinus]|uniref:epithelial cell adhesion molecule n=1 Tax=Clarias gariepinus TaxID=13013 RepID=UPI00234D6AB0|nr:epithelial cell adhesion molecule [Clarias gariepinus]XP_053358427.1 epithelial cell adhesion molecule [Clarias gariepinus]